MEYATTIDNEIMGRSTPEACQILGVSRVTMSMWILRKKIHPRIYRIGRKTYYDFPDSEIERVRKLLNKHWEPGQAKLEGEQKP